ncbi:DNA oxidative demethylase ALKBH2-like [Lycorma delicatula]|uniref:DNA oxidative demethylase ALKBH2-like n=1 Tax=Lycorma delicatula TaxID=130591 RepID=UPI003F5126C4
MPCTCEFQFTMSLSDINKNKIKWKQITDTNLNIDYAEKFIPETVASDLLQKFESEFKYFTGSLATVKVFGKWHPIPRQQVAFGDEGLKYKYSGNAIPALPWPDSVKQLRNTLMEVTGHYYNFVLVNKYRDGNDCMGEHRDDELELDPDTPIASLSFGETRDFVLKCHQKSFTSYRAKCKTHILPLGHGDLLLMNNPSNKYWTHCIPRRKNITRVRINLTFRKLIQGEKGSSKRKSEETTSPYFNEKNVKKKQCP